MDVANRFVDGEDSYHNKRARSPEDDRYPRPHNQRRRSRNYDNHNQVAEVIKGKAMKRGNIETWSTVAGQIWQQQAISKL
jgi:hypothetical protein